MSEYESFEAFVESKDFEFKTSSEKAFEELVETAKREKYYELASEEFTTLEEKLSHNNLKDLEHFQKRSARFLERKL